LVPAVANTQAPVSSTTSHVGHEARVAQRVPVWATRQWPEAHWASPAQTWPSASSIPPELELPPELPVLALDAPDVPALEEEAELAEAVTVTSEPLEPVLEPLEPPEDEVALDELPAPLPEDELPPVLLEDELLDELAEVEVEVDVEVEAAACPVELDAPLLEEVEVEAWPVLEVPLALLVAPVELELWWAEVLEEVAEVEPLGVWPLQAASQRAAAASEAARPHDDDGPMVPCVVGRPWCRETIRDLLGSPGAFPVDATGRGPIQAGTVGCEMVALAPSVMPGQPPPSRLRLLRPGEGRVGCSSR
jgi:hypothetical protein